MIEGVRVKLLNPNIKFKFLILFLISSTFIFFNVGSAQTTGKIAGVVLDAETGEPLAGANVLVNETALGASVDMEGTFFIINVPPGSYTVSIEMLGYETKKIENLHVSVNRTAYIKIDLKPGILEGSVIIVEAEKITSKKDQTSSIRSVSADNIEVLPIENVESIVAMQAGVVNGHFRGGRSNEVMYLIDGMPVNDAFSGEGSTVKIETESVQDLEVITGTFNAEYGRAMSGMVNQVTKDGGSTIQASASVGFGNYYTGHNDIFIGLDNAEITRNMDYKFQVSGPVLSDRLTFLVNGRYQDNKNHINGINRFEVDDYNDYYSDDPNDWIIQNSGDNSYIPMNIKNEKSLLGKLTYRWFDNIKTSLFYNRNDNEYKSYQHAWKYNPDGQPHSEQVTDLVYFSLNHTISNSAFYEAKVSYIKNYEGYYVYKNPYDERYVSNFFIQNSGPTGFYTGGQSNTHSEKRQVDYNAKFDLNWQISNNHLIKTGLLYTQHDMKNSDMNVLGDTLLTEEQLGEYIIDENGKRNYYNFTPNIYPDLMSSDVYHAKPIEFAAYLQVKMEWDDLVINFGIRFDYFNPKTVYPSDRRNPANQEPFYLKNDSTGNYILDEDGNQILDPSRLSAYPKASIKYQVSPRLGLAYQLGEIAVLHFSYGHFFQMPPMNELYEHKSFIVDLTKDFATLMGNAELKAQKTVKYEIGIWMELMADMGLEVALYYNDIYNLLSTKVVSTYNQIQYGLYTNKDYGNSRGLELKFDYRAEEFQTNLNYSLAFTRGSADNPQMTYDRLGNSQDPINKLIPMSWDQRHTINLTVGYHKSDYGVSLTGYYNSGTPYTWEPIDKNYLYNLNLYPNNSIKPETFSVDLYSYYKFELIEGLNTKIKLSVYNLLDRLNAVSVYPTSGQPYTRIIEEGELLQQHSNFNDFNDRVENPGMYSAPRLVKVGLEVSL